MRLFPKRAEALVRKAAANLSLLRRDPEAFARNLTQFTHPALFEQRLVNILHPTPMHVRLAADAPRGPRLNVLDAAWSRAGMTGGPNTVINLACRVAQHGLPVRLVSTVADVAIDPDWFRRHAASLLAQPDAPDIPILSAGRPEAPLPLGPGDMFLATHWTTAQQLKSVLPQMPVQQFFYMLQEFEPAFYPWSSNFALAIETFGMDFWPIVNESCLAEYLFSQPIGRLNDPVMRERALVFEPAVDAALFHPDAAPHPRRLLFYARPTNTRNLFGLGLTALREAAADPAFAGWEFVAIGGQASLSDLPLGGGKVLRVAPWADYAGYGRLLREADVLLCPMLSPHTSYPVLEMAASGGLVVTNTFATKTGPVLRAMSDNILAVPPTIAGFRDGVVQAARLANDGTTRPASLRLPRDWAEALDPVARRVAAIVRDLTDAAR